jgi:hypothetical protein
MAAGFSLVRASIMQSSSEARSAAQISPQAIDVRWDRLNRVRPGLARRLTASEALAIPSSDKKGSHD